ncbi:YihY/virulence factor BrkB family protein [Paracoccus aerius]
MLTILREIWAFISAVFERMDKIHMGLIAAGVAFYAMFAVFPGLAAIMALWSLWFDPAVVMTYLDVAHEFLPEDAADLIDAQIMSLASTGRTSVGWASFLSFMVATIAARAGSRRSWGPERRLWRQGPFHDLQLRPGLCPDAGHCRDFAGRACDHRDRAGSAELPGLRPGAWLAGRRPALGAMFLLVILGIGILYRYGPNVKTPRTPIFTWGPSSRPFSGRSPRWHFPPISAASTATTASTGPSAPWSRC